MAPGISFRGGIPELMRQAHRIQTKLEKAKEELKTQSFVTEAAGGKVKVTITGGRELTHIAVDPSLLEGTPEEVLGTLSDVIVSGVNAALQLVDEKAKAVTEEVTGGVRIPGMF